MRCDVHAEKHCEFSRAPTGNNIYRSDFAAGEQVVGEARDKSALRIHPLWERHRSSSIGTYRRASFSYADVILLVIANMSKSSMKCAWTAQSEGEREIRNLSCVPRRTECISNFLIGNVRDYRSLARMKLLLGN